VDKSQKYVTTARNEEPVESPTREELEGEVNAIKYNRAPRIDWISLEIWKGGGEDLFESLYGF
jgi:hypothetical protein